MKIQNKSLQLSKSRIFAAKLGLAALGMTFLGLYLFADYI